MCSGCINEQKDEVQIISFEQKDYKIMLYTLESTNMYLNQILELKAKYPQEFQNPTISKKTIDSDTEMDSTTFPILIVQENGTTIKKLSGIQTSQDMVKQLEDLIQ
ncbi:hypothetical protein [Ornithinibacillus contaminans]|uniref:hypothetical protein n=1 Tax=Ornithinibacillus contaminans TaxID=694055 RepID=UPI00064DB3AB|nr:hypothetical protein [Ornithinibacillus contaminans]